MADLAQTIQDDLIEALNNDQLELPTLPEVALRIRDEAEDQNATVMTLARVIAEDPGLASRMIRVANSPVYRAARNIEDLQTAVSRLGLEFSANLATGMAMEQMFQATSDLVDSKLRQVWNHASEVAGMSGLLAKHHTRLRPDRASLAGLTHAIGVLPILFWVEDNTDLLNDSMTLDRVIDGIHGSLGTKILEAWDFPPEIARVPSQYADFERQAPAADYADVVMVANLEVLSAAGHSFNRLEWRNIQAFANLGIDPSLDVSSDTGYGEDLAAARQAFAA